MTNKLIGIFIIALSLCLLAAVPAAAQTQLLQLEQDVPLAATLDNPCTSEIEAITMTGWTHINQEVWLMAEGTTRLVVSESTTLQGKDSMLPADLSPTYSASGTDAIDAEFSPGAATIYNYKRVVSSATQDNFHTIIALEFDPASLRLTASVQAACGDGSPSSTP